MALMANVSPFLILCRECFAACVVFPEVVD